MDKHLLRFIQMKMYISMKYQLVYQSTLKLEYKRSIVLCAGQWILQYSVLSRRHWSRNLMYASIVGYGIHYVLAYEALRRFDFYLTYVVAHFSSDKGRNLFSHALENFGRDTLAAGNVTSSSVYLVHCRFIVYGYTDTYDYNVDLIEVLCFDVPITLCMYKPNAVVPFLGSVVRTLQV